MVQREIEGIGLSGQAGRALATARSTEAVEQLAPRIQWCHSWVGADHLLSLYRAGAVTDVLEHARLAHLPAGSIARVLTEVPSVDDGWLKFLNANR